MSTPLPPLLLRGDCLAELARIPDNSVDAVVTDPPYGLANTDPAHVVEALTRWAQGDRDFIPSGRGFMGKEWDAFVPPPAVWDECARILKPGGHLLAFAGSRTFDLMTLSIRFAGFEIRDSIAWLYGSGFPKSMDVAKAIASGTGRPEDIRRLNMGEAYEPSGRGRVNYDNGGGSKMNGKPLVDVDLPDVAQQWEGWGTALKPAFEPVVVARKPLGERTVAANVLAHGTGALNIDATRLSALTADEVARSGKSTNGMFGLGEIDWKREAKPHPGRWPANVALDESQAAALDEQAPKTGASTIAKAAKRYDDKRAIYGANPAGSQPFGHDELGGASRFMYVAKAPKSERPVVGGTGHPTVKPLALMRWLLRLVTPPGGVVVDPFAGSGTTLEAAYLEGFEAIGCEMTPEYWPLVAARIERVTR